MQRRVLTVIVLFFLNSLLFAQSSPGYPKHYFRNPLGIPMELTSNFGELRSNHWHMGLDIRTRQKENYQIYAAADGYIAKVRIEPFGFGRSIFINHPNGLTTVYAHLNDFFPELEKYVTEQQYKQESWEIELDILKNKIPVFKSQLIAYSGNTGSSQGPHLHFEIRDTKTNKCLNPLLFGFPVNDNIAPVALKLAMYDRSKSVYDQGPQIFSLKKTGESYTLRNAAVIKTGSRKASFAIQAFDREFRTGNPNGIYYAKIYFDEKPLIEFRLDSIDYSESMYVNAQIDYKYRSEGGSYLQHLSVLPGDKGKVNRKINGDGTIFLDDSLIHTVLIEIKDAYRNTSLVNFNIQYDESLAKPKSEEKPAEKFFPNNKNVLRRAGFELEIPAAGLYDTVDVQYFHAKSEKPFAVSSLHMVNDQSVPVHSNLSVRIKPDKEMPEILKNKLLMQRNTKSSIRKAKWQDGWLTAQFSDFGSYQLFVDTIPPELGEPDSFLRGKDTLDLSTLKNIVFNPNDNFGTVKNFRAELDGKWLRFTNDKGRFYIYTFDERCPYGVHHLKVTVEDLVGNVTTRSWWFKRDLYTPSQKK